MADSPLYILDTDHISLLQRGSENVRRRLITVAATQRAVTVITVAEQVQGRLAVIGGQSPNKTLHAGSRVCRKRLRFINPCAF